MNWYKTRCQWCPQLYASAGAYVNHLAKIHPENNFRSLEQPKSRKHRLSDISHTTSSSTELEIANIGEIFLPSNDCSDREEESEGSDEEVRYYSSDAESDEASQQSKALNTITQSVAGIPIREHFFPERDPGFNLYSPFRHPVNYRLACFFNAVHASERKIDQFFKNGILQALNPTHPV
ncbi:hypothetical protein BGX38DRAFT_1145587 [Terfezia claveryi]|nr:hypothetical protein BGX38DRAFT_1145587 [Terfezia claveryi]